VGQIVGTHGVRGEMRLNPWCDGPEFLKNFKVLYFEPDGEGAVSVLSCRPHGNIALIKLEGVDSIEKAAALRSRILFMDRDEARIEEGSYFIQDLIGCAVFDADTGETYGRVCDVSQTPGVNDAWHIVAPDGGEYLIPAIPEVVISADVEIGVIKIRPLKGMF